MFSHLCSIHRWVPRDFPILPLFWHNNHLISNEPPYFPITLAIYPYQTSSNPMNLPRFASPPWPPASVTRSAVLFTASVRRPDESNRMVGLKLGKGRRANTNVPQLDFFGFCRVVFPFRYHQRLLLLFQYLRLYSCSIYPTEPGAMVCIQAAQCKIPIRNGTTQ